MGNELYELLSEPIKRAAKSAAINWHGLLEEDDIEQMLWVEILESRATVTKLRDSDQDLVVDLLTRMAERVCIKERDDYEHYTGNFRYSVNEAKAIVGEFFLRSGEEIIEEFLDTEVALEALLREDEEISKTRKIPREYYKAIHQRYALGEVPRGGAAEMRLSRALTRLADMMNRNFRERTREFYDGPQVRQPTGKRLKR